MASWDWLIIRGRGAGAHGECKGVDLLLVRYRGRGLGYLHIRSLWETLVESTEGAPQFGPKRPHVYSDLNFVERDWYNADIRATNILLQGLPKDIYTLINHYTDAKDIWDNENKMVLERLSQPIAKPTADPLALMSNVSNTQHGLPSSSTSSITPLTPPRTNSTDDLIENLTNTLALLTQSYRTFLPQTNNQLRTSSNPRNQATVQDGRVVVQNVQGRSNRGGPDNAFDDDVDEQPVQDLSLNVDNVFQAEDCDAFDSDVDEAPTAQTMFMANLSSADLITDETGPSYDSDIQSELQDHDQYLDDTCAYQEEHVMHDSVQLDHVFDLHADHTSSSNMIPYDQYVKDNDVSVVHSNASSVLNDTFMMIYDDMCEPIAPSVSNSSRNAVVKNSLTTELATYREQVELYERRAQFELTNREQEINEQLRLGQAWPGQARTVKCYNCNGTCHIARNCTQPKRPQNSEYFKDKMLLMQAQENRVALDAEQLLFLAGRPDNAFDDDVDEQPVQDLALNMDNVFQAEDCDAFDSDVDEAPTAKTMFMANLSSADPITDEAGPSYDLDILSEVQDHDQYLDDTCAYQEEHVMHDSVQLDYVFDLHADHTSSSNMILYDQYVKDNDVSVVYSNASSIPNDTFMMIYDDMCEPIAPSMSNSSRNAVVKNSLTAELATYREQVELYERRAQFELTDREQEINEQLRLVISDHNHARVKVHNSEDTLETAEITRKKMNAKMTDPECVTHKVKTAPHDYSKENLLATFTPQKQLTPEQINWSNDLMKLKSEALKE
nr:hypothetical protein [Tanacetum cinerariifolium]